MTTGPLRVNAYFLVNEETGNAVCIDGGESYNNVQKAESVNGFTVKILMLTHAHFDHSGCAKELQDRGVKVYISEKDAPKLSNDLNLGKFFGRNFKTLSPDKTLQDGEEVDFEGMKIKTISTPGHTDGSVTFLTGDMLFTGDTLFCDSVGRTDLPGGNRQDLCESVKKLFSLSGDYRVFPGHENFTTLERERKFNRFAEFE